MSWQSRPTRASFEITADEEPSGTLLVGISEFGLAGLTAVEYLVEHLDLEETGYVTTEQLSSITPFEDGQPRHHTRLFSRPDLDVTVLVGELFVPVWAAGSFANAILDWTGDNGVEEIAVLSGVPVPHGPEEHRVFYIATDDYRQNRLDGTDIPGMGRGFLDGVNATLVRRGMDSHLETGVFVTPVHAQTPDVEAALRLTETISDVYDLSVDTDPLKAFAEEVGEYYAELAARVESARDSDVPDDRMYM
ncbi:proteasome assembly chaperone family protein [Haladaptatus pallidirubidus]|uniref:Proteasome assembly chaperone family protein n=1 Tax=Haladaptatus pallidirubidus TaxID=1008152 RepID=A0AAV3UDA2_9EURY|nr:PAC2 family protein [Haladaptatus pallidirubidus]